MTDKEKLNTQPAKREWVEPEVRRLEAGAAESQAAGAPDGSGQQAS